MERRGCTLQRPKARMSPLPLSVMFPSTKSRVSTLRAAAAVMFQSEKSLAAACSKTSDFVAKNPDRRSDGHLRCCCKARRCCPAT